MEQNLLENLNNEQIQAVKHENGPLLIVAGAGTGKTTVITRRIAYLIMEKGLKADEILALTFTDKAAGEMEERIDIMLPYGYFDLWVSTFHAFCERILKEHGLDIGLPHDFALYNQTRQWILVRQNLDTFNLDYYKPLGSPTKFVHALLQHFSRAKDEGIYPEDYLEYAENLKLDGDTDPDMATEHARIAEVAHAYHVYQKLMLDNNALDFGDLINYTRKLFRERPAILKKYQEHFKYILVDEFQDTNWAQYDLIKMLGDSHKNITVVGDDDQSIYKFRGASISNILEFKNDYPDCAQIVLTQNYRSVQPILDLSYGFIQNNNPNRLEYQLNQSEEISGDAEHKGVSLKDFKKIDKRLQSNIDGDGYIEMLYGQTFKDEITLVVEKIHELKQSDSEFEWSDCAVLVRANAHAAGFVSAFETARIPHFFMASSGLFSEPFIMDLIAYLRVLQNSYNSASLYRLLQLPCINVTESELITLMYIAGKKSWTLVEAIKQIGSGDISDASREGLQHLFDVLEQHRELAKHQTTTQMIWHFLQDLGYMMFITDQPEAKIQEYTSLMQQFLKLVDDFESTGPLSKGVRAFMEYFDLVLEAGDHGSINMDPEQGPDTVKIMTVHASKGLEFKYVFVVNMVERRFPSMNRSAPIQLPDDLVKEIVPTGDVHIQEERRLFYVAATRAKVGLYLTAAKNYGGARDAKPSRFFIDSGLIQDESQLAPHELSSDILGDFTVGHKYQDEIVDDVHVHIPTTFSFSQLKAYETCPWQYYYKFILKIPVKGRASLSFGRSMHAALERFFSMVRESDSAQQADLFTGGSVASAIPSVDTLLSLWDDVWIDEWYESKDEQRSYYEKGKKLLKEFYAKHVDDGFPNVAFLEKGFKIKIGEYSLRGVIDRIDRYSDDTLGIVDYKTGNKPKTKTGLKDQLLIYKLAIEEIIGKNVSTLAYYYLEDNDTIEFEAKEKDTDKLKQKLLKYINGIQAKDFEPKPNPVWCRRCDYRDICQFKKL